ncbi:unnamed protein product [Clavelina lepadiformis]|uniref:Uncharacterized protein n=1 Tax=Clavelina lepadiformis TaxID=159417 RepID=A0ABP0FV42_CLALP
MRCSLVFVRQLSLHNDSQMFPGGASMSLIDRDSHKYIPVLMKQIDYYYLEHSQKCFSIVCILTLCARLTEICIVEKEIKKYFGDFIPLRFHAPYQDVAVTYFIDAPLSSKLGAKVRPQM